MKNIIKKNEQKWNELVVSDVPCGKPKLNLDEKTAKDWLNKNNILGDLKGKKVLCLASGGGQQSIGFALLGAEVTVVDFSEEQLKRDKEVADKYKKDIKTIKTDMQDLSMLKDNEFDIVYQPYSINYIPSAEKVFSEVSRVIKSNGIYHLMLHNPYVHGTWKDGCWGSKWDKKDLWREKGYPLWQPYEDGYPITTEDKHWNFTNSLGKDVSVSSPQEFKHTLSTVLNSLIQEGFSLTKFEEEKSGNFKAVPGSWDHYRSVAPPWLYIWMKKN